MSHTQQTIEKEPFESQQALLDSCRRQLIEDKLMVLGDNGYVLTNKGMEKVLKEFQRYEMRPGMTVLIETYILQVNDVSVY